MGTPHTHTHHTELLLPDPAPPPPHASAAPPKPRPDIWLGLRSSRSRSARRFPPPGRASPAVPAASPLPAGRQARADSRPAGPRSHGSSAKPGRVGGPRQCQLPSSDQSSADLLPRAGIRPARPPQIAQSHPRSRHPASLSLFSFPVSMRVFFFFLNPYTFFTSPSTAARSFVGASRSQSAACARLGVRPRCAPSFLPRVPWNLSVWVGLARSLSLVPGASSLSHNLCFKFPRGPFPSGQVLPSACQCASPPPSPPRPSSSRARPGSRGPARPGTYPSGAHPALAPAPLLPAPV